MFNKSVMPLAGVLLIVSGVTMIFKEKLEQLGVDWQVLNGGNIFLYIVTMISMHMLLQSLNASNTHAFITKAYGGIMIKLFTCAAAAFVYILLKKKNINKPALFGSMGLYLVYTFIELKIVMKQSNLKKNADK